MMKHNRQLYLIRGETLRQKMNTKAAGGFSLLELMVVVAIVGTLAAVAIPAYYNNILRSRQSAVVGELMSIKAAEERFFASGGNYASSMSSLPAGARADGSAMYYSTTSTYTSGYYRYWITGGTINAKGDLNGDGNFTDLWTISVTNLSAKPTQTEGVSHEGFSWKSSLAGLFS